MSSILTHKGPRFILGTNCEKMSLFKAMRKNEKKRFFFNIQPYKFVQDFYGNEWKKF